MDIKTLTRNVDGLIAEFDNLVLDSAMELKNTMADLNVMQLEKGLRSDGKKITPKYSKKNKDAYLKFKKSIGIIPQDGTPNLKVESNFHSGIYAAKKNKEYIYFWSNDEKADKLNARYAKIFGLTVDSIGILQPDLPEIIVKRMLIKLHKQ